MDIPPQMLPLLATLIQENQNLKGQVENLKGQLGSLKEEASDLQEEVNGHEVNNATLREENARLGEENASFYKEADINEKKLHHAYGIIAKIEGMVTIWIDPDHVVKHTKNHIHYRTLIDIEQALNREGISLGYMYVTNTDQINFFNSNETEHLVVYAYIHEPKENEKAIRILDKFRSFRFSRGTVTYVTNFIAKSGKDPKDFKYAVSRCCKCRKSVPGCVCDE